MKRIIWGLQFTVYSFLLANFVFAGDEKNLFEQGNKFYQEKEYAKAIELYDSILKSGYESATLYFNLGNAFFKDGENTKAIINYEKAKKLNPGDEDIEFNLRLANLRVADKIEPLPRILFTKLWAGMIANYSSGTWAVILVGIIWLAFTFGLIFIFTNNMSTKKISFFSAIFILLFSLFISFIAYSQYQDEQKIFAIVFSPNAYIKSAPDEKGVDLFILHEGVKVELKDEVGEWGKIKLEDGKEGWVKREAIENI